MATNPLAAGLETHEAAEPLAVFIFGVTGDLTRSKLMPALYSLFLNDRLREFRIVGFARRDWSDDYLREKASSMLEGMPGSDEQRRRFLSTLTYLRSTFEDDEGYKKIPSYAEGFANKLYYLSTPPSSYNDVIGRLGKHGLAAEEDGYTRIIVEKPFGRDLRSARELNKLLLRYFKERQVYRIDHYLGKETVQNLMMLRFGNGIFEPVWNNQYIDHVQITVAESSGVGTRGNYYEKSGALRDMIQNHAFQLLSITAMEPPNDIRPESIRSEKLKVIRSIDPITLREPDKHIVRAQYARGVVDGEPVHGYREEDGVDPESRTETYVAMRLYLDTWRWAGVPFVIRSGKRLSRKVTEISIHFKHPPLRRFAGGGHSIERNVLAVRIQPEEAISLKVNAKIPGYATAARPVNLDFTYGSSFGRAVPEAYERLLFDAMKGDNTLYTRRDEIEAAWEFITGVLEYWKDSDQPLYGYEAGSAGPREARDLLGEGSRRWRKL
ncbi:MAG: glucose-6-phosphate dehydrogenase [Spirochaetales bacterium]